MFLVTFFRPGEVSVRKSLIIVRDRIFIRSKQEKNAEDNKLMNDMEQNEVLKWGHLSIDICAYNTRFLCC